MTSKPTSDHEARKVARENEPENSKSSFGSSAKRRRLPTGSPYIAPPSFWDNLSKITICRRALKEFDRRAKKSVVISPPEALDIDIRGEQLVKLQRFARQGGPNLINLRGYSWFSAHHSIPDFQNQEADTMYDAAFSQHLADNGITLANPYCDGESALPSNHADIKSRLAQRRPSLSQSASPNTDDYERFVQLNKSAQNATSVIKDVLPLIIGHSDISHSGGFAFRNLKPLTDKKGLKPAFSESYDGCLPGELNKLIREQLGEYIFPLPNVMIPCLPTFFTECAGPAGAVRVGERHILYTGALGARAVHHLRSFTTDHTTALDNNAYVLAALYDSSSGMLWIYAIRAIASPSPSESLAHPEKLDYRMTLINHFGLTLSTESFREGINAIRNAREWAKEQRDELVRAANAKAESNARAESGSG